MSERALHVGFYSPALPDSGASNGIVTYTRVMRDALRRLGHSVTVVTTTHIEHADGRVEALPQPNRLVRRLQLALERRREDDGSDAWVRYHVFAAIKAARKSGVEVFEMEESYGWAARVAGRGMASVERLHGPHVFGREPRETLEDRKSGDLREIAERDSFAKVEAVTSPSGEMLDDLLQLYGLDLPLCETIPNPIELAANAWDAKRADPEQILCVGRFDLRKGADVVLRAFAEASEGRPLKLVMAGPDTGIADESGKRWHFEEFTQGKISPETKARIQFLGPLPPERIAELRLQSTLALVGSRFENFPYSIAEAMAAGMPVLTSATFGGNEMVRDGVEGRVVPIGDSAAMRDAMLQMMNAPQRLAEMGRAALDRAATWLSPERVARETVSLYRKAMARR